MKVTFCGHSDKCYNEEIPVKLYHILKMQIQLGATTFLLGGYGWFDGGAATTVKKLKEEYPYINSLFVTPYINKHYNMDLYDESIYPPLESVPLRFAISARNKWMVDSADVIISCVKHSWGGAAKTLEYAKRKNKTIIEL